MNTRNYNTISPSAKAILFKKGYTNIPFARKAAELVSYPEKYMPDFNNKEFGFWARTAHFENRYWSIDQLLNDIPVGNILELSSGFSFRGLDMISSGRYHYIDTDLEEIIELKAMLIRTLNDSKAEGQGKLESLPLNALDEGNFESIIARFNEGPITIVNEGLLMYLGNDEKEKLCKIIYETLKKRGGYWITADIYVKARNVDARLEINDDMEQFFAEHRIEENKFENFETAELFFRNAGFVIDKEAQPDFPKISSLEHLLKSATADQLEAMNSMGKPQATWRLKVES